MNSAKLNDWMQVFGIFALVASLLFVGLQMRQTQEIAQATLYQMRSDSSREMGMLMVDNSEVRDVMVRIRNEGIHSLTPSQKMQFEFSFDTMLGHFENSHHLYQLGFSSQEQWDSDRRQIAALMDGRTYKLMWTDSRRSTFRESFAVEIDAIVQGSK